MLRSLNLREARRRFWLRVDSIVSRLRCKAGRHEWQTPKNEWCSDNEPRYGIRRCRRCGREEHLMLGTHDGSAKWHCHEDTLKRLNKTLRG